LQAFVQVSVETFVRWFEPSQKKAANIKKLAREHHREAAEAVKVASKAQKNSLTAANIARKKNTKEAQIAA